MKHPSDVVLTDTSTVVGGVSRPAKMSAIATPSTRSDFHLYIQQLDNGSFVATLLGPNNQTSTSLFPADSTAEQRRRTLLTSLDTSSMHAESGTGALYYVIAVVLIYGFSIILMIASQIRKNRHDKGVAR